MSYLRDPMTPFNPVNVAAPAPAVPPDQSTIDRLPAALDAVRILSPSAGTLAHGEEHWRRVATLGLDIAEAAGGDRVMIVLFAMLHDAMRFTIGKDPDHGMRGGFLAACLNAEVLGLSEARLDVLDGACRDHSLGLTTDDPTVGACWDADRSDLVRFDRPVEGMFLSTLPSHEVWFQRRARTLLTGAPDWDQIFHRLAR